MDWSVCNGISGFDCFISCGSKRTVRSTVFFPWGWICWRIWIARSFSISRALILPLQRFGPIHDALAVIEIRVTFSRNGDNNQIWFWWGMGERLVKESQIRNKPPKTYPICTQTTTKWRHWKSLIEHATRTPRRRATIMLVPKQLPSEDTENL